MLAQENEAIREAAETVYQLTREERIRMECEAREDYYRTQRDLQNFIAQQTSEKESLIQENKTLLDERNALTNEINTLADENSARLNEKNALADENNALADENNALVNENNALADEIKALTDKLNCLQKSLEAQGLNFADM